MLSPHQRHARNAFLIWNGGFTFGFTLIVTVNVVYQFTVAHLSPLQLILIGTILEVTCFLAQIPTGLFADIFSRRWALIIGTFLVGCGFAIEGLFPHFGAIIVAQCVWGLGITLFDGADSAWLADEVGEGSLESVYLRSGQLSQVLALIAIPISAVLASIHLNLPILLGSACLIVLAATLPWLIQERNFTPVARAERTTWQVTRETFGTSLHAVQRSPLLRTFLLVELCYGLASEGWDRLWQPYLLAGFNLPRIGTLQPVIWVGIVEFGAAVVGIVLAQVVQHRLNHDARWHGVMPLIIINTLRVGGMILFALTHVLVLAIMAYWLVTALRTINRPLYDARFVRNVPVGVRATVLSLRGQVNGLGQIVGGPGVGVLGNRSLRVALGFVGVLLLPNTALFARVRDITRRVEAQTALGDVAPASDQHDMNDVDENRTSSVE